MTPVVGVWLRLWMGGNLKVGITQVIVTAKAFDQRVSNQGMCHAMHYPVEAESRNAFDPLVIF